MGPLSNAAARMFSTSVQRSLGSSAEKTVLGEATSGVIKKVDATAQKIFQNVQKSFSEAYTNLAKAGNKVGFSDPIEEAGQTFMDVTFKPDFESSASKKISHLSRDPILTASNSNYDFTSFNSNRFTMFNLE